MSSETRSPVALTHRYLETLAPARAAFRIPDARCAGLAIRVAPSGVVTFDLAYRIARSKKFRRLSLGKFPSVSLEAARNRANELTRAARAGRDLLGDEHQERLAAENRISVGDLVNEYVTRRVKGRLRSAVAIEARLKRALGTVSDRPADEIRRRDLRRLLDATADGGHVREAEQRRITLNGLFRWAVSQDHIENNPTVGLTSFGRSPPRQRVLNAEEIQKLWAWLATGSMPPAPADILRLQLCLGARCTEIGGMCVEEFDTDSWLWKLPAERSKNKRSRLTPIVGLARDILKARIAEAGAGRLFLAATGKWLTSAHVGHFLLNHAPPIARVGTHDLRRTVATQMVEGLALPLDVVARVIGHQAGGPATRTLTSHYVAGEFIEQKEVGLLKWDARLRSIIAGENSLQNVVPFAGHRAAS